MTLHRHLRRWHALLSAGVLGAVVAQAAAVAVAASQLSGYAYIDRNNDGQIAFSNAANPEWILSGIQIKLFSVSGSTETLLSTIQTDSIGHYLFGNLGAGTYDIRETQPIQYVDGLETVGTLASLINQVIPPGASAGAAADNLFSNIVLPDNVAGQMYNFGERGLAPAFVSKRFLLGTAPPPVMTPPPVQNTAPEPHALVLAAIGLGGVLVRVGKKRFNRARA